MVYKNMTRSHVNIHGLNVKGNGLYRILGRTFPAALCSKIAMTCTYITLGLQRCCMKAKGLTNISKLVQYTKNETNTTLV